MSLCPCQIWTKPLLSGKKDFDIRWRKFLFPNQLPDANIQTRLDVVLSPGQRHCSRIMTFIMESNTSYVSET